jgi:hypothetical protein
MRKLGTNPLTGAEKQKRHRERVKARLAEAEKLKQRLADVCALPYLLQRCDAVLSELGADAEERAALAGGFEKLDAEISALVRERAGEALGDLRSKGRRGRSSLLARLSAVKRGAVD